MGKLFITTKDRPNELAVLCKSILYSDFRDYISEVVFLDDDSKDVVSLHSIISAFSYFCAIYLDIPVSVEASKFGHIGINKSLERILRYKTSHYWVLNGDMMVCSDYFSACFALYEAAKESGKTIVSGFNTTYLMATAIRDDLDAVEKAEIGGCSVLFGKKELDAFASCLRGPTMERGWDKFIRQNFDSLLVTRRSHAQHLGVFEGYNQNGMAGFPGAFAKL